VESFSINEVKTKWICDCKVMTNFKEMCQKSEYVASMKFQEKATDFFVNASKLTELTAVQRL